MFRYAFVLSCLLVGICRFVCQSHTSFPRGLCFVAAADYFLIFEKNDPLGLLSAWEPMSIYWCGIFLYCMARLCWRAKFHERTIHASGLLFWILFSMICPPVAYLCITLSDLRFFCIRPKTIPVKKQQKAFALGLFFLLLCDLCVVLSFLGWKIFRSFLWGFYVPALVFLSYADTSRICIHDI